MTQASELSALPAEVEVLIAGGRPSGLFLAADLAHRGIRSLVTRESTNSLITSVDK